MTFSQRNKAGFKLAMKQGLITFRPGQRGSTP